MAGLVKPKLAKDEVFFPIDSEGNGRIIQLHELQRDGKTLTGINQYQAVREAERSGGYVLSLAEDQQTYDYARTHNEDPQLNRYLQNMAYRIEYARYTRTQVHSLRTDNPFVVNIKRVHPEFDLVLEYEDKIAVPWLPRISGFIQELDQETRLPKKVGTEPNPNFNKAYYKVDTTLDVVAVVRYWLDGLGLYIDGSPSFVDNALGVRLARDFKVEGLESRTR